MPTTEINTPSEPPKLSAAEFKVYNHMAENMEYFHRHFKQTFGMLEGACDSGKKPAGMSVKQFLAAAEQFCWQLNMHHGIEEEHIFPVLAKKMPEFKRELQLVGQHREIHTGLEKLGDYVHQCRSGVIDFRLAELKEILDSFGPTLKNHLNEEVKTLGAENMRKYWTVEEMKRLPM